MSVSRPLIHGFADENGRRMDFEDPVDVYRGCFRHLTEAPQ